MRTVYGDLWNYHERGAWAVVTTNLERRTCGDAVMGAGVAAQARYRFPDLPRLYGDYLSLVEPDGKPPESPLLLAKWRVIMFPTKHRWRDPSPLALIEQGLGAFSEIWEQWNHARGATTDTGPYVAFPPLGCGLGARDYEAGVRPLMERYLRSDRFAVVLTRKGA